MSIECRAWKHGFSIAQVVNACRVRMPETGIARSLGINYRTWM